VYTFVYGYRCTRLSEIEVKLCRLTWFKRRIIDGSLQGTIYNQCYPVTARRETFQNVTTVLICFNGREQPAAILRFNSNIHALNGMSLGILETAFVRVARACTDIGIKPLPLSFYCIEAKLKPAFVFGFAAWTPAQIRESLLRFASALR